MILPCFSVSSADEVLETGGRLYICLILACFAMDLALRMILPCFSVSSADEVLETGGGALHFVISLKSPRMTMYISAMSYQEKTRITHVLLSFDTSGLLVRDTSAEKRFFTLHIHIYIFISGTRVI